MRVVLLVFAIIFATLALGYFLFLRVDYSPVFTQLRPADASAIVAQLGAKQIDYRLRDGGTTVMVPNDQADQARLAVAGSDIPLKGGVGFELFNKSDMGLTDFAQRINYQRALQGELERTIMMLDDVETARVHLAIPERSLFRSDRSNAKAAVEIVAKIDKRLDEARVAGIQRLVAFSVPDLAASDVVILDGNGRVLSASSGDDAFLAPGAEEQQAVQRYYRARARAALDQALPGVQVDVRVMAFKGAAEFAPPTPAPTQAPTQAIPSDPASAPTAPRDFRLRVELATSSPLNAEDRRLARNAVASAIALNEGSGDELLFQIGIATPGAAPALPYPATAAADPQGSAGALPSRPPGSPFYWLVGGIALLSIGAAVWGRMATRSRSLPARLLPDERAAMVERLRAALRQRVDANAGA
ncbi:flagellar basal-body MS-ring/collar protein FliF [uncultured Sphingomonas sp.]|uniref:flagellar basal-body MS-ring/collar protein FliF n=1 Tax=uncultured Sphingomonas sp. TaxID=158754 RepID=UPI0035CAB98C